MVTHGAVLNPRPGGTILSVFQWSWVPDGAGLPTPLFIWQPILSFLRSKGVWRGVRAKIRSEEKSKAAGFSLFKWQFSLLWCSEILRHAAARERVQTEHVLAGSLSTPQCGGGGCTISQVMGWYSKALCSNKIGESLKKTQE